MEKTLYEKVREKLDTYSVGMNATPDGVEMDILKRLFEPDEAAIWLHLTEKLEPARVVAQRAEKTEEETDSLLQAMLRKGLLFGKKTGGGYFYAQAPFMHGLFEHRAMNMDADLAKLLDRYFSGAFMPKDRSLRTIPIGSDLNAGKPVLPFDDVKNIIMKKDRIAVFPCACAKHREVLGEDCSMPTEVCMAFDFYADFYVNELGWGRWVDREEALTILIGAERAGLVHQVGGNTGNTECICNCCGDCCGVLRFYKRFPKPSLLAATNYFAVLDRELCTQCGVCIDRCPMEAISDGEGTMLVNRDRCIGCGLCTSTCPAGALALEQKAEDKVFGPPKKFRFMRSSGEFEADVTGA
ncbi:MAG: 4Fe-4S ferredoxin [Spirochaetae bacterium HGW-Spirochaetae-1]|jgi:NAD-dependent dihydropyrimidine dehydrogenase PreA subunit|nr:MAG: 4Fe-4S ferredoxin [Spirochaetae bacterium HGW-Spirochaetae-1]